MRGSVVRVVDLYADVPGPNPTLIMHCLDLSAYAIPDSNPPHFVNIQLVFLLPVGVFICAVCVSGSEKLA